MDWLKQRTAVSPNTPALIINAHTWTYAELDELVEQTAVFLHNNNIRPDDHVAALLPNGLEYVCLVHALARLGAVLVPLNGRLTPIELQWQIDHIGCKAVVRMDNGELIIDNEEHSSLHAPFSIFNFQFSINNVQAVVFTSGTSGKPKGAMITFANHFWSATASAYRLGVSPDDRWLSVLPLYHVGGLAVLFRSCLYGTAVILHTRFHLPTINASLDNDNPTLISLVPTMLLRLLDSRQNWPSSLRLILLGGAASPPDRIKKANALPRQHPNNNSLFPIHYSLFPLVAPTYGLTEATSQVATMPPNEAAQKPGCVGKPLMFTSIKIVGEDGEELPPNQIGEIIVTGPTVMAGYWGKEIERLEIGDNEIPPSPPLPRSPAPPLRTGDLGYLDNDGDLWIVQRRTDLIVTGGENVYPSEVEKVLRGQTAVYAACVVGIDSPEWGQTVAAMVQLHPNATVTEAELLTYCRQQLAGYKLPRHIQFVNALPQTASGKIARHDVKEQLSMSNEQQANPVNC